MKLRSILVWAAATVTPAFVGAMDGQLMIKLLRSQNSVDRAYVEGYISAVDQQLAITGYQMFRTCPVITVGSGQRVAVVDKYLTENPEIWHYQAPAIIEDALTKAFPCKNYRDRNQLLQDAAQQHKAMQDKDQSLKACEARLDVVEQRCSPARRAQAK